MSGFVALKRAQFPRFYFLTDSDVLEMLSACSRNPHSINKYIGLLFDGVTSVEFDGKTSRVVAAKSQWSGVWAGSETLTLNSAVVCSGAVECWLVKFQSVIGSSIGEAIMTTRVNAQEDGIATIAACPVIQVALVVLRISWTEECETALKDYVHDHNHKSETESPSGAMLSVAAKIKDAMGVLVDQVTNIRLPREERQRLRSLVQYQLQSYEICKQLADIVRHYPASRDMFEWQQQIRTYTSFVYRQFGDGGDWLASVKIGRAEFSYGCEFLAGQQVRMVSTPLTDRCYVSLAQAVAAFDGGAVVGPAGVGKTVTVRELGHSLGVYVMPFTCTAHAEVAHVDMLLKGIAQAGFWVCMDSFNRLAPPMMSLVATMIRSIFTAMKQEDNDGKDRTATFADGWQAVVHPRAAIALTLTPGAGHGRSTVSADLSEYFKPVTLALPQRAIVARVRMFAAGFNSSSLLSRRLDTFYSQCSSQLSGQSHYDFSMRVMVRVVDRMSSERGAPFAQFDPNSGVAEVGVVDAARHSGTDMDEQDLCVLAVMQISGCTLLSGDDQQLFSALLADVFPGSGQNQFLYRERLYAYLTGPNSTLRHSTRQITKAMELHAVLETATGVAIIGPAACGKTEVRTQLLAAMRAMAPKAKASASAQPGEKEKYAEMVINPKALTVGQLYGQMDENGDDWLDGVFTKALRKANACDGSTQIVLDGAIDSSWIDGMASVFDDVGCFLLTNGNRISVSHTVTVCFEVETLQGLSPASTTRLGIVHIGNDSLSEALFEQFTEQLTQTTQAIRQDVLLNACKIILPAMVKLKLKGTNGNGAEGGGGSDTYPCNGCVASFCALLTALLPQLSRMFDALQANEVVAAYERAVIFAAAWSFGATGPVTHACQERMTLDAAFRSLKGLTAESMPALTQKAHFSKRKEDDALVFDYGLQAGTLEWIPWRDLQLLEEGKGAQQSMVLNTDGWVHVATRETRPCMELMKLLATQPQSHVMITGRSEGKTALVKEFLSHQPQARVQTLYVAFSRTTPLHMLSTNVHAAVELRHHTTYGPSRGRHTLMLCIDDLNIPSNPAGAVSAVHEETRQLVELGQVHQPHEGKGTATVVGCSVIGIARSCASSKMATQPRLKRHFTELVLAAFRSASMQMIFTTVLDATLGMGGVGQTVMHPSWSTAVKSSYEENLAATALLARIAVKLTLKAQSTFIPTPLKRHYTFDFRDVVRIIKGMCHGVRHCGESCELAPRSLLRLCVHECCRVLQDKMIEAGEVEEMGELMRTEVAQASVSSETMKHEAFDEMYYSWYCDYFVHAPDRSLFHANKLKVAPSRIYARWTGVQLFEKPLGAAMARYRGTARRPLSIMWSRDAVEHLLCMVRNIGLGFNQVVVGDAGSGRRSMIHMAAGVVGAAVRILVTDSMEAFLKQLTAALIAAATKQKRLALVLSFPEGSSQHSLYSQMADILSSLTAGYVLPGPHCREAVDASMEAFKQSLPASESMQMDDAAMDHRDMFVSKTLERLHFFFLVPGDEYPAFLSRHPALSSASILLRFDHPTRSTLIQTARRMIDSASGNPMQSLEAKQINDVTASLADVYIMLYDATLGTAAAKRSGSASASASAAAVNKSALSRVNLYRFKSCTSVLLRIFREQHTALFGYSANLAKSLKKLAFISDGIEEMDRKLKRLYTLVDEIEGAKESLVGQIQEQKKSVAAEITGLAMMGKYADAEKVVVSGKEAAFGKLLYNLGPVLEDAIAAVNYVKRDDLSAMKRFATPPRTLSCTIDAILLIFHKKVRKVEYVIPQDESNSDAYRDAKPELRFSYDTQDGNRIRQNVRLQTILCQFRLNKNTVNDETLEFLEPYVNLLPGHSFASPETLTVYGTLGGLSQWVASQIEYEHSSRLLAPNKVKLEQVKDKYKGVLERYKHKQEASISAGLKLTTMKHQHDTCVTDRHNAKQEIAEIKEIHAMAEKCLPEMRVHQARWEGISMFFTDRIDHLIGNCCLASCYVSYLGPYSEAQRAHLRNGIENILELTLNDSDSTNDTSVVTAALNLPTFLANKLEMESWVLMGGLSDDPLSLHNAAMVLSGGKLGACLCIDPCGQARRWLEATDPNTVVHTFVDRESFLTQLRKSLEFGEILLVCHADAALEHIPTSLLHPMHGDETGTKFLDGDHQQQLLQQATTFMAEQAAERRVGAVSTADDKTKAKGGGLTPFGKIRARNMAKHTRDKLQKEQQKLSGASADALESDEEEEEDEGEIFDEPAAGFKLLLVCDDPNATAASADMLCKVGIVNFAMSFVAVERHLLQATAAIDRPELLQEHTLWSHKVCRMAKIAYDAETVLITSLRGLDAADTATFRELARGSAFLETCNRDYARHHDHDNGPSSWMWKATAKDPSQLQDEAHMGGPMEIYRPLAVRGSVVYQHTALLEVLNPMAVISFRLFVERFKAAIPKPTERELDDTHRPQKTPAEIDAIRGELTKDLIALTCGGLGPGHSGTFVLALALETRVRRRNTSAGMVQAFISGGAIASETGPPNNTGWLPDENWRNVVAMNSASASFKEAYREKGITHTQAVALGCATTILDDLIKLLNTDASTVRWKRWYEVGASELRPLPVDSGSSFELMCIVRCLRPDKTWLAAHKFVSEELELEGGVESNAMYLQASSRLAVDTEEVVSKYASPHTPVIFVLPTAAPSVGIEGSGGVDAGGVEGIRARLVRKADADKHHLEVVWVRGEATHDAEVCRTVKAEQDRGGWALVMGAHRGPRCLQELTTLLASNPKPHPHFRLFIVTEAHAGIPRSLLAESLTVAAAPPHGLRATLKAVTTSQTLELASGVSESAAIWQRLSTVGCYLHAVLLGRRSVCGFSYGSIGFTSPVVFGQDDLSDALGSMRSIWQQHVLGGSESVVAHPDGMVWRLLRHAYASSSYGSRLADRYDHRLIGELAVRTMGPLLVDHKASLPTAPMSISNNTRSSVSSTRPSVAIWEADDRLAVNAGDSNGNARHRHGEMPHPVPPADNIQRFDEWLDSQRRTFADEPECYWLHPHVAVEARLRGINGTLHQIEEFFGQQKAQSSIAGVSVLSMGSEIEKNFDSAAMGAASAGGAVSPQRRRPAPQSADGVGPRPPRTPRKQEDTSGRTQYWAGGRNNPKLSSKDSLQTSVGKLSNRLQLQSSSIGKAVDDMKKTTFSATEAGERDLRQGPKNPGMVYSDHHAGQFVRKTKVSAVTHVAGHTVTEAEERAQRMATELLERVPPSFNADAVMQALKRRTSLSGSEPLRPLSSFAAQEAARVQNLVGLVRGDLHRVRNRLAGHMSPPVVQLHNAGPTVDEEEDEAATRRVIAALMNAETPRAWLALSRCGSAGGQRAGLGGWFASVLQSHEQLWRWIFEGPPLCFWLPGFYHPTHFIAAVRQEAMQQLNLSEQSERNPLALDRVGIEFTVSTYRSPKDIARDADGDDSDDGDDGNDHPQSEHHQHHQHQLKEDGASDAGGHGGEQDEQQPRGRAVRSDGVWCFGLSLEGAGWDNRRRELKELPSKYSHTGSSALMHTSLPVMRVHGVLDGGDTSRSQHGNSMSSVGGVGGYGPDVSAAVAGGGMSMSDHHGDDKGVDHRRSGPYECPIYADSRRGRGRGSASDASDGLLGCVSVGPGSVGASHWALRGVSILATVD